MCVICLCKLKDYIIHQEIEERLNEHYSQANYGINIGYSSTWRYAQFTSMKHQHVIDRNTGHRKEKGKILSPELVHLGEYLNFEKISKFK